MKKLSMLLTVLIIFGTSAIGHTSDESVVFEGIFKRGHAIFERAIGSKGTGNKGNGTPVSQFGNFSGSSGEATLKVCKVAEVEKISSATISINGNVVLGSSNFNQNVGCIEKKVNLNDGDNILEVLLKSKPGGKVSIEILQLKPDIPSSSDVCDGDGDGTYPNTDIETIYVGANPAGVSVSPDGKYVYVTNLLLGTVSVIPTSDDNTDIETIDVGEKPAGISVSPDGKYVYVTHPLSDKLSVIPISDNNTDIETIYVGSKPWGVSVSPDGKYVYVNNYGDSTVSVISTSKISTPDNPVIDTIPLGDPTGIVPTATGVSVSPDGKYVYVTHPLSDKLSVIPISDDNTDIETIDVGEKQKPTGVSVSPDGKYVYVSNCGNNTVSVISICDNNTDIETIYVGSNPWGVSVSPDGNYVYVSNYVWLGTVSVLGFKFDDQIMNSF